MTFAYITKGGCLYTWGYNDYGQPGDGTTKDKDTPVKIMDNVIQVSSGSICSACITKDGSLYTWGNNKNGSLGIGSADSDPHPTPIKITIPANDIQTAHKTLNAPPAQPETQENEPLFSGSKANETYNLYAFKDLANGMTNEKLLYITQQTADENDCIDFSYKLKGNAEGTWIAVPMTQEDISAAEVTLDDLEYTGEEQFVSPTVKLNDETLTAGVDYYLEGDFSATDPGEYTVTVVGTGLYKGSVSVTYKVIGNILLGDANGDGSITVTDISKIAAHVKGIKALN